MRDKKKGRNEKRKAPTRIVVERIYLGGQSMEDAFRKINETVTTNPQGVIDQIKSGSLKDYRIPS